MKLESAVLVQLREARWGSEIQRAIDETWPLVRAAGFDVREQAIRAGIYRAENGAGQGSPWWPVYLSLLGVETQTPTLLAISDTLEERLAAIEGGLAGVAGRLDSIQRHESQLDDILRRSIEVAKRIDELAEAVTVPGEAGSGV